MVQWETNKIQEELSVLKNPHFVVIDIETTGLSPDKGGRIIEIAAVRVLQGKIADTFHTLVNPQLRIPAKITGMTGITDQDVKDKPTIFHILPQLYQFIRDAVIVCHNVSFDWDRFLIAGFKQVGIHPNNPTFCTMKFFKKVLPGRGRGGYTLDKMCDILGVTLQNHHQALDDTTSTAKCLISFIQTFSPDSLNSTDEYSMSETSIEHTPVKIKQVRYWEKRKNAREMFRRHYVRISTGTDFGTVYFDIPSRTWGNKDFPLPLDFEKVERSVLLFLGIDSREELIHFRN